MRSRESVTGNLTPASWALSDDQTRLRMVARDFARERLEPLLASAPGAAAWEKTVTLAATLDLTTMILPERLGGLGMSRHDLALVVEQFAAGPLERAAALTLSSAALMTLRECDALERLPDPDIGHYLDGTSSIALGIPDADASGLYVLRQHCGSPAMMVRMEGERPRLALTTLSREWTGPGSMAVGAGLFIERHCAALPDNMPLPLPPAGAGGDDPVQHWLADTAIYLAALLSGAIQQGVNFALGYCTSRQAFRKPLMAHELVAARLADMMMSANTIHLFLRSVAAQDGPVRIAAVSGMARHVATEAMDVVRELVQLCGGHGYVEGLPPAARLQTVHWFAMLLVKVDAALRAFGAFSAFSAPTASA